MRPLTVASAIQTQGEFDVRVASSGQLVTTIGSTRYIPPPWRSAHQRRSPGGSAESDRHPCRRGLDRQRDTREDRATAYPLEVTKGQCLCRRAASKSLDHSAGCRPSTATGQTGSNRARRCWVVRGTGRHEDG